MKNTDIIGNANRCWDIAQKYVIMKYGHDPAGMRMNGAACADMGRNAKQEETVMLAQQRYQKILDLLEEHGIVHSADLESIVLNGPERSGFTGTIGKIKTGAWRSRTDKPDVGTERTVYITENQKFQLYGRKSSHSCVCGGIGPGTPGCGAGLRKYKPGHGEGAGAQV